MSNQIDLSKPVWCGGKKVQDVFKYDHGYTIWEGKPEYFELLRAWNLDGTPLGYWPPLTNEPPVGIDLNKVIRSKPILIPEDRHRPADQKHELPDVEALENRIAELEGEVKRLEDDLQNTANALYEREKMIRDIIDDSGHADEMCMPLNQSLIDKAKAMIKWPWNIEGKPF